MAARGPGKIEMLDRPAKSATLDDVLVEIRALRRLVEQRLSSHSDDDDQMTVTAAATICRRTPQTIRNWVEIHHVGEFDPAARRYRVSRQKLRSFLVNKFGEAPAEI
jgi:hypothetical protein